MTYQDEYYDDYTDNYAVCEDEHALQEDIPTDTCCEPYPHTCCPGPRGPRGFRGPAGPTGPELREIPVQMELRGQQGRGEQQVLQEIPEPPASQGQQGQQVKMALPDRRVQQDLPEVPDHRD